MKAILEKKKSRIINWGESGIEVGTLPKGVSLRRLRWDNVNGVLVDLADLSTIWVEYINGIFHLHAWPVPGSQLVAMNHNDPLIIDGGTIRPKTSQELVDEIKAKLVHKAKSKAKLAMEKEMGLLIEQFMFNQKLMYVLIWALRTQNAQGLQFVDDYLTEIGSIFDITDSQFKADLIADYKKIKKIIKDYQGEIGGI